jgi:hypothetical protein
MTQFKHSNIAKIRSVDRATSNCQTITTMQLQLHLSTIHPPHTILIALGDREYNKSIALSDSQ